MLEIILNDGTIINTYMVGLTVYYFEDKKLSDLESTFNDENLSHVTIKEGTNVIGIYDNLKVRSITKDYIRKQEQVELSQ